MKPGNLYKHLRLLPAVMVLGVTLLGLKTTGIVMEARAQDAAVAADAREQARLAETLAHAEVRILTARNEAMAHVREIALQAATAMVERLTGAVPTVGQLRAAEARIGEP